MDSMGQRGLAVVLKGYQVGCGLMGCELCQCGVEVLIHVMIFGPGACKLGQVPRPASCLRPIASPG